MSAAGVRASVAKPSVAPGLGFDGDVPVDDADPRRRVGSTFFNANPEVIKLSQPLLLLLLLLLLFVLPVYLLQHIDAVREQQVRQELFLLLLLGMQRRR